MSLPPSLVRAVLDAHAVALLLRHRLALLADLLVALLNHLLARHESAINQSYSSRCKNGERLSIHSVYSIRNYSLAVLSHGRRALFPGQLDVHVDAELLQLDVLVVLLAADPRHLPRHLPALLLEALHRHLLAHLPLHGPLFKFAQSNVDTD